MELSPKAEAKWSEFRLTTARGLAKLGIESFCRGEAPSKTDSNSFFAFRGEKSEGRSPLNFPMTIAELNISY